MAVKLRCNKWLDCLLDHVVGAGEQHRRRKRLLCDLTQLLAKGLWSLKIIRAREQTDVQAFRRVRMPSNAFTALALSNF